MAAKAKKKAPSPSAGYRWEYGELIPRAVIRDYARQIAEQFQPEKIILFGSYAYGEPHQDSDVDLLVVMPAYDEINQAVRILRKTEHHFPLDLIVRTPERMRWRLDEGDWFLREIVARGRLLYEKPGSVRFHTYSRDAKAAIRIAERVRVELLDRSESRMKA